MGASFFVKSIKDGNDSLSHKAQKLERVISVNKVFVNRNETDNEVSKVFNLSIEDIIVDIIAVEFSFKSPNSQAFQNSLE